MLNINETHAQVNEQSTATQALIELLLLSAQRSHDSCGFNISIEDLLELLTFSKQRVVSARRLLTTTDVH